MSQAEQVNRDLDVLPPIKEITHDDEVQGTLTYYGVSTDSGEIKVLYRGDLDDTLVRLTRAYSDLPAIRDALDLTAAKTLNCTVIPGKGYLDGTTSYNCTIPGGENSITITSEVSLVDAVRGWVSYHAKMGLVYEAELRLGSRITLREKDHTYSCIAATSRGPLCSTSMVSTDDALDLLVSHYSNLQENTRP